jgi:signal transduction histidine kinase
MSVRDWPMARKFFVSTVAITLAAVSFISLFMIVLEKRAEEAQVVTSSRALLEMIAGNAAASLMYDDEAVAAEILEGATAEPSTRAAALYDGSGKLYAWHLREGSVGDLPQLATTFELGFSDDYLDVFAPVMINGRVVGTAFLRTDLTAMHQRFNRHVVTVVTAALVTLLLVFALSRAVEHWITRPLTSLAEAAQTIADEGDYSVRVQKESNDEVGRLVDAFNHMVREVQLSRQKVHAHAETLERTVAERTARLQETVGELEAFSYSVSHDMRTPLRAMRGYADCLLEDLGPTLDEENAHLLRRIRQNAGRLDLLIRDVLAYSKVSKEELVLTPISLTSYVEALIAQLPPDQRDADFVVKTPMPVVKAHEAYLSQIFTNLISNAVKFRRPEERARVEISAREEGDVVKVTVRDHGIGIDPAHFGRIFEIFGRVHPDTRYEGTGIGLAIVKKAVQRMGGEITLQSPSGAGTCFIFTLPRST